MKLIDTTLRGFMSFGKEEITHYWKDLGLVLFEGDNRAASSASSNGAGKTNFMEAVIWCNYGKTTKGVGADDVVNEKMKKGGCMVRNRYEDPETGDIWTITRYRKDPEHGNNLIFRQVKASGEIVDLNGVDSDATQNNINAFLGGSLTLFCNSTYFSQNNIKPFSLFTDKQIKDTLMEALDLGRFASALVLVRADLKDLRTEHDNVTGKLERVNEEITEAGERFEGYKAQEVRFDENKKAEIKTMSDKLGHLKARRGTIEIGKEERRKLLKQIEEKRRAAAARDELASEQAKVQEAAQPLNKNIDVLEAKYGDIHRQYAAKQAEIKEIEKRIGTDCPECGKKITEADVDTVLKASAKTAEALREKAKNMSSLLEKAKTAGSKYKGQMEALKSQIDDCDKVLKEIEALKRKVEDITRDLKQLPELETEIEEMETAIAKKELEKSPFLPLIKKEAHAIGELVERKKSLEGLLMEKKKEIEKLEYLEIMFGYAGIPSFLLDSVAPFLNERANHYATLVCGGELQITFSTTSRTKTGKVNDKFSISVSHTSGASKYKGISGGERKRADLCIAQAMQDLCRSYGRNPLDIIFYDEPFEHLDSTGISGVIEMLAEIEKEIGTVAVVTHNEEMKSMFDKTVTVVKEPDGYSRLAA